MKKLSIGIILIGFVLLSLGAAPSYKLGDWQLVRSAGDEDAANSGACLATATAADFAQMSSTAFKIAPAQSSDTTDVKCILSIMGEDTANETFSFVIYGYAEGGPAEFICEGDGILGAQTVVKYPNTTTVATDTLWADTINVDSTSIWVKGVLVTDSGNDRIAHLTFYTTGLRYLKVFFYDANDATTEAGQLRVYARFY